METPPMCKCGQEMTTEKSTITTMHDNTTTITDGEIYICKPCIEKSDKE